ncbi:putative E3 ubiquitin-protein ligase RF298 [Aristolochia californica]|uniref:putative E3 ubiquitin-protein ligase RF298 n=1 Tax=Aristolochia californica TaxID=171875 RepID=UPI0035E0219D
MAAMVARGNSQISSSISVQDKGSRNKRKFRADPPLSDSSKLEFPMEKSQTSPSSDQHGVCDLCSLHQDQLNSFKSDLRASDFGFDRPKEELECEEFHDADWSDITETHLEELLLSNLDTIFRSAIKKITSFGYSVEVATKAVLRSGVCYGCKDTVSNIVDNTLAFLRNGQEIDSSREHFFEDLAQLEKYILAEMVCVLREVRPFFSTGDAMWCLLICDMNVSHACAMDTDVLSALNNDDDAATSSGSNASNLNSETNESNTNSPLLNLPKPTNPNSLFPQSSQSEIPTVAGIPNLPAPRFPVSGDPLIPEGQSSQEESSASLPAVTEEPSIAVEECLSVPEVRQSSQPEENHEKFVTGKKTHSNSSKRESMLRQKSIHFEKSYRAYGAKATLRSGKLSAFGGLVLDKKCKSVSDTTIASLKSASLKLSRAVGAEVFRAEASNKNLSSNTGPSTELGISPRPVAITSPSLIANTELSLSLASGSNAATTSKPSPGANPANNSFMSISSDKIFGQWVPQDKKDGMLLQLVPRVRELQTQLQEWTEWAQQKVMQAARRLSKDKAELKSLRQEKEEVARLKKEKQTLEENTMKKLSEMENALCKASGQVERANAAVCRLEVENAELRQEMEAAKLRAAESAASCQEVSRREIKTLKKFQSWEKQKAVFQEELVTEKRKLSQLQQQLEQAKEYQNKLEARLKQEEKVKNDTLMQANSERKEREQIDASAKSKEDMIRLKAENDFQRYRDDIRKLENEIAQLRLKTDSSKIAALKWALDCTYASCLTDGNGKSGLALKETKDNYISGMTDLPDLGAGDVQRERECVMCLTEEMSVVFLPCAHQVVCTKCNELHEKQGMKDCPSCRTPIQRRIAVRSADS